MWWRSRVVDMSIALWNWTKIDVVGLVVPAVGVDCVQNDAEDTGYSCYVDMRNRILHLRVPMGVVVMCLHNDERNDRSWSSATFVWK